MSVATLPVTGCSASPFDVGAHTLQVGTAERSLPLVATSCEGFWSWMCEVLCRCWPWLQMYGRMEVCSRAGGVLDECWLGVEVLTMFAIEEFWC
mmetsp:Transcript_56966/g.133604  ORF Transcript_56966/g.133604 Transcript_56966/m.133604 type:complete len:94 (-) Transcript_56966:632-913(-)